MIIKLLVIIVELSIFYFTACTPTVLDALLIIFSRNDYHDFSQLLLRVLVMITILLFLKRTDTLLKL